MYNFRLGEIVLSEVMFKPINGAASSEWVEVVNTGASSVDLSGWQFGKPSASDWSSALPAGTTLGPNQALVITPSASTFDGDWGSGKNRIQVGSFPGLPDDPSGNAGRIAVRDGSGAIQDEITYLPASGWPNVGAPNTSHSIYVFPQHLSASGNNAGGNWGISTTGLYGGTYQHENHASPGVAATTQQAAFAPSPDAVWSMVVLPDTQNYVERTHAYPIFEGQTNWIKDNKELFNIQAVLVGGNGNDVVLNLVASELNSADFDEDGDVNGSDFLTWQRGLGTPRGANRSQGDANNDGDNRLGSRADRGSAIALRRVPLPLGRPRTVTASVTIGRT